MKKTIRFIILLLIKILSIILFPIIFLCLVIAIPVVRLLLWIVEDIEVDLREMCEDILYVCFTPIRTFFDFE